MMRSPVILGVMSSLRPRRSGMRLGGHSDRRPKGECMQHAKDFTRETVKRSVSLWACREKKRDHRTRRHVFYRLQSAYGETYDCCRDRCREPETSPPELHLYDLETPIHWETRWRFCCLRRNRKHTRVANRQPCRQQSSADQVRWARRRVPSFSQASSAHARHVARRHSRLAPLYSDSRPRISSSTTTLVEPLCLSATGVALLVSYA